MNPYSQVVIIDELSISDDEKKKMKAGQTTETEETLTWLADNTAMTLAALSSTSLLDRATYDAVSETKLDKMITRSRFEAVSLKNIMRSSKNIASATSLDSFNQTWPGSFLQNTAVNIPWLLLHCPRRPAQGLGVQRH